MTIRHILLRDGAFIAGDTANRRTSYAYPTSPHATEARRKPAKVAAEMMASENAMGAYRDTHDDYDLRNWKRINGAANN